MLSAELAPLNQIVLLAEDEGIVRAIVQRALESAFRRQPRPTSACASRNVNGRTARLLRPWLLISKTHSHSQLERAWPPRSEHLRRPASRLAECSARQVAAVAGEIRAV